MQHQIVHTLAEDDWRSFVDRHPHSNIFHTPEMYQVYAEAKGYHPSVWAAIGQSNQPLALMIPVEVTGITSLPKLLSTRAVAYGSVLCDSSSESKAALGDILRAYLRRRDRSALFTELRNLSDLSSIQPLLEKLGFRYEEHLNYLIDLNRPEEAVLQGIGRRTRKQIRRGLRQGEVKVTQVQNPGELALVYELLQKTYAAARVPLADRSLFEAAFRILHPRGMARFMLARVGEKCAACSVELLFKDTVYGWYGGGDREFSAYVPNELLMWHVLRWGVENGYRLYDFGGAGKPDEDYGVRDFKAKFGGQLVSFGRNTHIHAPRLLRLVQSMYEIWRRYL